MKKNLKLIITGMALTVAAGSYAQAGVDTPSPSSILDVRGKKDTSGNVLPTDVTGFQAPRLTQLTAKGDALYGAVQKGAQIYITNVFGGDLAIEPRYNVATAIHLLLPIRKV